ncbi:MAG: hypothetical protein RBS80_19180 [Thermoguttaceae bacterium]|jgi:hypothetical protein|nr:hypothetical protein [Thermoguttaceae bacterium]
MSPLTTAEPITPTSDDARLAKASSRRLAPFLNRNLHVRIEMDRKRLEALNELAAQAQELDMGY